jgi:hypothetical protein
MAPGRLAMMGFNYAFMMRLQINNPLINVPVMMG